MILSTTETMQKVASEQSAGLLSPTTKTGQSTAGNLSTPVDKVSISPEAKKQSEESQQAQKAEKKADSSELTQDQKRELQYLKRRDREVRSHEQAHLSAAGGHAKGGASFTYQTGADGRRYAVGGEVPIDVSKEKNPEQTVQKMRQVRSAALAPADPSPADRRIAASASQLEAEARREILTERTNVSESEEQDTTRQDTQTAKSVGPGVSADPAAGAV